jgi:acetoin utilization protein AcuA
MNELRQHLNAERTYRALNGASKLRDVSVHQITVEFEDRCTPEVLAEMVPAPGIGAFSRYSPQAADRQHAALITVAGLAYGRVLVAHRGRQLVAYLTFHPPEGECRWASLPRGKILELGGIEVARGFRGMGLARRLMDKAFAPPDFDDVIVYAQALTWCWDIEGSGMSMADYRQMMLRLFGTYGFKSYATDEPNIQYDQTSFLLGRMGPRTPPALVEAFQALLIQGGKV